MEKFLDAVMPWIFIGVVFMFLTTLYGIGNEDGLKEGRCTERWKYQHTQTDTIQTIRSGCDLPTLDKR